MLNYHNKIITSLFEYRSYQSSFTQFIFSCIKPLTNIVIYWIWELM